MKSSKFLFLLAMLFIASVCDSQITLIITPDGNPAKADTIFNGQDFHHHTDRSLLDDSMSLDTVHILYCHDIQVTVIKNTYDTVMVDNSNWYSTDGWHVYNNSYYETSPQLFYNLPCPSWNGTFTMAPIDTAFYVEADSVHDSVFAFQPEYFAGTYITIKKNIPDGNLLCFATIDTNSVHTIIAFDTDGTGGEGIDSVYLYYYSPSNTWVKIDAKSYTVSDTAEYFVDMVNNPNATPQLRYAVRTIDTLNSCSDTSALSNYQQTMYISSSGGTFSWPATGYQIQGNATPVLTYYLVRNDTVIDSVGGNSSVIIDPNYSPTAVYYVEAKLNEITCELSPVAMGKRATLRTISNTSRSNKLRNGAPAGIDEVLNSNVFKIYPNPSSGSFSLDISQESDVRVYDIMGQTIYQSRLPQGHNQIDIKGADGVYLISVNGVFNKIIKE